MADITPTPASVDLMNLLLTKVLPATAGAYVRWLVAKTKTFKQLAAEMLAGVVMVLYTANPVAGAMWYGGGKIAAGFGIDNLALVMARDDVDRVAAFLVGLVGLTMAEGVIGLAKRWRDLPTVKLK